MKRLLAVLFGTLLLATSAFSAERPRELSKKELMSLLTKASTPSDHLRLSAHYEAVAKRYQSDSAEHAGMAKMYRAQPTASDMKRPMSPDTAVLCEFLAETLSKASKEATALAAAHKEMATK
jgi:hypothetical protein